MTDDRSTNPASSGAPASQDAGSPQVSIMIVAYNSADCISDCLGAIASACARHSYEVVLIDNGDGASAALAAKQYPKTVIVPSRGNIGFAAANNLLADVARAPYLLLLNPDLEMKPGAVDALLDAAARYPSAAAWGGVTLDRTGRPDLGNAVHVPSLLEMASRLFGRSIARLDPAEAISSDARAEALCGGFVMFARAAWDEAGGLDERYFLYCEEVDLFVRLARNGHVAWRIAAARGFHDIGHGEVQSPMRTLYRTAGLLQFARLHWSPARQFLAAALLWIGAMQRFLVGQVLGRWKPELAKLGESHRHVALHPRLWWHGYDPQRGLQVQLASRKAD